MVARGYPYRLMWSARRVSTVIRKTRRGAWKPEGAAAVPVSSLPRQAARIRKKATSNFESLSGTDRVSSGRGMLLQTGLPNGRPALRALTRPEAGHDHPENQTSVSTARMIARVMKQPRPNSRASAHLRRG